MSQSAVVFLTSNQCRLSTWYLGSFSYCSSSVGGFSLLNSFLLLTFPLFPLYHICFLSLTITLCPSYPRPPPLQRGLPGICENTIVQFASIVVFKECRFEKSLYSRVHITSTQVRTRAHYQGCVTSLVSLQRFCVTNGRSKKQNTLSSYFGLRRHFFLKWRQESNDKRTELCTMCAVHRAHKCTIR